MRTVAAMRPTLAFRCYAARKRPFGPAAAILRTLISGSRTIGTFRPSKKIPEHMVPSGRRCTQKLLSASIQSRWDHPVCFIRARAICRCYRDRSQILGASLATTEKGARSSMIKCSIKRYVPGLGNRLKHTSVGARGNACKSLEEPAEE